MDNDRLRPLTDGGSDKMRQIARGMLTLKLDFDEILASPYRRTLQTAEIVAGAFRLEDRLVPCRALAPDGNPAELVRKLATPRRARKKILLVGHEPYLSALISRLLTGAPHFPLTLKKGGLCKLEIARLSYGQCATLQWLMTPRQLRHCG